MFEALRWRLAGPHRGGRVVAVTGDPNRERVFYFGACAGGVWKSTDAGESWLNISDGYFKTAAVGAIAVAEADSNIIYVGTGEACIRGDVSHGDGVYKSTDGGETWQNIGLRDSRHIARVRIHPTDPDLVYVAVLGHAFGPNEERGVFRTRDGGRTWERVLFTNPETGAIDLAMDPSNPRILYAAMYQVLRQPWHFSSGGPGSAIFKSTDGGDTWVDITDNPGLPKGLKGRIGIGVSPANPKRVWALIEHSTEGGVYRSDDGGLTWAYLNGDHEQLQRPWYFMNAIPHPTDPDTLFTWSGSAWKSVDGGRTFTRVSLRHGDNHDLWIDRRNPDRMISGNDGGASVSLDGGITWTTQNNQPTAQFYHVTTDTREPYRIYGAQQDNTTLCVPSWSDKGVITKGDCYPVGGSESGYIAVRPDDPDIVYAGGFAGRITRYNHRTGQARNITVWPEDPIGWGAKDLKYRFQWTFPLFVSPHDPNVLYTAGNRVFRSTNEGDSWEVISPDLTRDDISKQQPSGGPVTLDNVSTEIYCTVFALAESPVRKGLLWAGSDDGLIHITKDGGATWENVTPPDLPEWALISIIEPSPFDPAVAYVAATRYKLDDYRPYLLKTTDYGKTWTFINNGIPENDFTRVVRADPVRRGLLYAGTETGVYVSLDDGASWQSLQLNLPVAPIHDLHVKGSDLIAATHGRSFWVLDDLSYLRQVDEAKLAAPAHLFQPRPTIRRLAPTWGPGNRPLGHKAYLSNSGDFLATGVVVADREGNRVLQLVDAAPNPPSGVGVVFNLRDDPTAEVSLTFKDSEGNVIDRYSTKVPAGSDGHLAVRRGMNRFYWDMRYSPPRSIKGRRLINFWGGVDGPLAAPGTYVVELAVGDTVQSQTFEIRKDARIEATDEDLREQFRLLIRIRDKMSEVHDAVSYSESVRAQIQEWLERARSVGKATPELEAMAASLTERMMAAEDQLHNKLILVEKDSHTYPPMLNSKLVALASFVAEADARPTKQAYEVYEDLARRADEQIAKLRALRGELDAFAGKLRDAGVPHVVPSVPLPD